MASTYELIETTTLSSSASSVSFTSITQDYRDLVLVVQANRTTAGISYTALQFNTDTGLNYSYVTMDADGSSIGSNSASSQTNILASSTYGDLYPSTKNIVLFNIMDYSATDKHKSVLGRSNNVPENVSAGANRWANTAAITSVNVFLLGGGDFDTGNTFSLYGISA